MSLAEIKEQSDVLLGLLRDFAAKHWEIPVDANLFRSIAFEGDVDGTIQVRAESDIVSLEWKGWRDSLTLSVYGDVLEPFEYIFHTEDVTEITESMLIDAFDEALTYGCTLF